MAASPRRSTSSTSAAAGSSRTSATSADASRTSVTARAELAVLGLLLLLAHQRAQLVRGGAGKMRERPAQGRYRVVQRWAHHDVITVVLHCTLRVRQRWRMVAGMVTCPPEVSLPVLMRPLMIARSTPAADVSGHSRPAHTVHDPLVGDRMSVARRGTALSAGTPLKGGSLDPLRSPCHRPR